jgi:hypothetical protein
MSILGTIGSIAAAPITGGASLAGLAPSSGGGGGGGPQWWNPFDDKNGPFKGSGNQMPLTAAQGGQNVSGLGDTTAGLGGTLGGIGGQAGGGGGVPGYWGFYGQGAMDSLQQQNQQYQNALNQTAQVAQESGQNYGQDLRGIGQASAAAGSNAQQQLAAAGQQYAGQLAGGAQSYAGQQQNMANQAVGYGMGQAGSIQAQGQNISNMGAGILGQGQNAQGVDVNGSERRQLESLESQQGPSQAQAQLQQATNANTAAALAMARSGRGFGGSASSMRAAADQRVGAQQTAANQSAVLKAQEDAAWRSRQAANLQAGGQLATQQAQLNNQREAQLYGLGLGGMEAGAGVGIQGAQVGQAGIGQGQAGLANAGNTYLSGMGAAANTQIGALGAGAGYNLQGLAQQGQAVGQGGQLEAQGIANAGNLYGNASTYGLNNQTAQGGVVNTAYGLNQQAIQNDLTATGINNGVALGQQQMANQQQAAWLGMIGTAGAYGAAAASDRNVKEGIEPTNVSLAADDSAGTIVQPKEGTAQVVGYDPYSQGVGISGPNQIQGPGASAAAAAAAQGAGQGELDAAKIEAKQKAQAEQLGAAIKSSTGALAAGGQGGSNIGSVNPATGQPWYQIGGGTQALPAGPGMLPMGQVTSDEREKEAMKAFDATPGYSYDYKDPEAMGATHGRQFGIMAQDLEKTPAGKSVVHQAPNGTKMVDTSRLALIEGAAINGVMKRLAELEARMGKSKAA